MYGVTPRPRNNKRRIIQYFYQKNNSLQDMKKMDPQDVMNVLLPNKNVNKESRTNNCQLSEEIQKLL